jgi:serine/threonine protein phosphatase PrpC
VNLDEIFSIKSQEQVFDGELESLVLASDGLWDAVENEVTHYGTNDAKKKTNALTQLPNVVFLCLKVEYL